jgi:ABC-2 type transport system permease protein
VANLLKWWQTIRISWSRYTAYRINFVLQIIGPAVVFFFIKYNLWNSIYDKDPSMVIKGYNFDQMISYHLWSFIVALLAQGHTALNLSLDIRMGRISTYLIYPFNFWEFHTASFIGFQLLQLIIALISLLTFQLIGILPEFHWGNLGLGVFICLYVSFFWFMLQYFTGILAFWLEETWILRVILQIITVFLSGAIIPLDLFPPFLQDILNYTPFPYLTYYPIKVLSGQPVDLVNFFTVITSWIGIGLFVNTLIWRRGVRLYTAAGM